MTVAVVTDSSACLPPGRVVRGRVFVVPLHVAIDGTSYDEGVDVTPTQVAAALRDHRQVTTSRPSPGAFLQAYEDLLERGIDEIVSVHLSAKSSATISSAEIAGQSCAANVRVVDSGSMGMAMGFAVLAAANAAQDGASADEVEQIARAVADRSRSFLYVDTLEHLRRGGRIGRASSVLGSALAIKPLLTIQDGAIELLEKVRTSGKALTRLRALAVEAAAEIGDEPDTDGVDIAVQHLDAQQRAEVLAEQLAADVPNARQIVLVELGAALGAHVGPGMLAVAVAPRLARGTARG